MQKPQSKQSANFSQHSVVDVDIGVMIMMMEGFNSISQNARIVLFDYEVMCLLLCR